MAVNLISMVTTLSKIHEMEHQHQDNNKNKSPNKMNVKLTPGFFVDRPEMEKSWSSSSSSATSPNILLGIKSKVAVASSVPQSNTRGSSNNSSSSNNKHNQASSDTLNKPLPFHSHKDLQLAERSIKRLVEDSHFFPPQAACDDWFLPASNHNCSGRVRANGSVAASGTKVTTLHEHEVHVGRMLGRGGFCQVRLANINNNRHHSNNNEYAIKYLQASTKSKSSFARGAADLAIEARFLSLLSHENIITLHHVSEGTLAENYNCLDVEAVTDAYRAINQDCQGLGHKQLCLRHYGYFLILDYLRDTLLQRIQNLYIPSLMANGFSHPKVHHNKHKCSYGEQYGTLVPHCGSGGRKDGGGGAQFHWWNKNLLWKSGSKSSSEEERNRKMLQLQAMLRKRLGIMKQIACALEYLHSNGIIFRDVKPDNIGFYFKPNDNSNNCEGIPKLFDFGLVKELKPSLRKFDGHVREPENVLFKLTGRTGSRRYMAPEVALYKPYNLKADTYSFGILLYETATLVQPFDGYSLDKHETQVLKGGERPCLMGYNSCGYWPKDLRPLIEECWADDMTRRPTMSQVVKRLDGCLVELSETRSGTGYYDNSVNSTVCHDNDDGETMCTNPLQVCKGAVGRGNKRKGLLFNMRANFPSAA